MSSSHGGGCMCAAVRYAVQGDPLRVTICHCKWCQRRTGSAFAVETVFNLNQVEILSGMLGKHRHVSDESARWLELEFCQGCGTNIGFTLEAAPGIRTIGAGTFDDPSWISSGNYLFRHVFLRSAQDWSDVPKGVETFEAHFRTDVDQQTSE